MPHPLAASRASLLFLVALAVAGCGGGGGASQVRPAPFRLTVEPAVSGHQGADTLAKVTLARDDGFTDRVTISLKDGVPGIGAAEVVLTGARADGWLRLAVSPGVAVGGPVHLTVVAAADAAGVGQASAPLDLNVLGADAIAEDKIEAARAAGTLDDGTALLYRAYALFGDTRLPEAYRGAGSAEEDNDLLADIRRAWSALSADAQAALHPFMVRPSEPDSWYTPPATQASPATSEVRRALGAALPPTSCADVAQAGFAWISRRSATNPVRVWVSCTGEAGHDALATQAMTETLDVLDKIWGPETALMKALILDGTDGGDDAIDVYIDSGFGVSRNGAVYRPNGLGTTFGDYDWQVNNGTSAFIVLPEILLGSVRFHPTIIHELFHVLQRAHNATLAEVVPPAIQPKGYWFYEASATWASQYFDRVLAPWPRGRGGYQDAHMRFLRDFQMSGLGLNSHASDAHAYSAYIWPYFVEQSTGGPDFVGRAWAALDGASGFEQADDAVDGAYPFIDHFREFALRNVNTALLPGDPLPRANRYIARDSEFRDDMKEPPAVESDVAGEFEGQEFHVGLPPLTARYLKFKVSNRALVQIVFDTSDFAAWPGLDVDVLVKVNGNWEPTPRKLNGKPKLQFCRDKAAENVDEVRFILANHQRKPADIVATTLRVTASTIGCQGTWHGTSYTADLPSSAGGNARRCAADDVTWVFDPIQSDSEHEHYIGHGTVKYTTADPAYQYDPSTAIIDLTDQMMYGAGMDVRPDPSGTGFFITGGATMYFPTTETWTYQGVANVRSTIATCAWFSAGDNGTKISDDGTMASADMTTLSRVYGFSFTKD